MAGAAKGIGESDRFLAGKGARSKRHVRNGARTPNSENGKLRAAEFFAGIGLVRVALEQQNWDVVFANDIDENKAKMYRDNWPNDNHLVVDDIRNLGADQIPNCDLFTASFPCNDLSIAGRWEGLDGVHSSAFWQFVRILAELRDRRPPLVLLENVLGFLLRNKGEDLHRAMRELDKLGYSVDAFVLNAKHWVPQSRPRLFVLAKLADGADRVTWTMTSESRPPSLTRFIADHQDICWDIFALPALPESGLRLQDILDVPNGDDHDWWPEDRASYFINQLSERHSEEASRMIAGKTISYATAFRRMRNKKSTAEIRTDGIAGCLRTPRGGSARQILFEAGLGTYRVRLLRPSECAKLQGVDQTYRIDVALNQALAGFGDAVCVPVIRWIEQNVIRPAYCQIQLGASRRQPTPELSARHDANEILRFHSKDVVR